MTTEAGPGRRARWWWPTGIGAAAYAILKRLIRTKYITLFNIAAKAEVRAGDSIQDRLRRRRWPRPWPRGSTTRRCGAAQVAAQIRGARQDGPRRTRSIGGGGVRALLRIAGGSAPPAATELRRVTKGRASLIVDRRLGSAALVDRPRSRAAAPV